VNLGISGKIIVAMPLLVIFNERKATMFEMAHSLPVIVSSIKSDHHNQAKSLIHTHHHTHIYIHTPSHKHTHYHTNTPVCA